MKSLALSLGIIATFMATIYFALTLHPNRTHRPIPSATTSVSSETIVPIPIARAQAQESASTISNGSHDLEAELDLHAAIETFGRLISTSNHELSPQDVAQADRLITNLQLQYPKETH